MNSISQLPAEEIHRLMTTPNAMRLEDIPLVHLRAAELLKDAALDKKLLDWIEQQAKARKIEIAKSIFGTGFEIGEWPSMRVTVKNGDLRTALSAAMQDRS